MRKQIITGLVIIGLVLITHTALSNRSKKEQDKLVQEYKDCIIKQSQEQGYIIRSYCSLNYKQLDQLSGLQYIQKGYDLYLKQ